MRNILNKRRAALGQARKAVHVPDRHTTPATFSGGIQMDVGQLGQLIASLGFPIVAACAMFWYVNKEAERHRAESKDMQKSLNDNTKVLEGLKELITILVQKIGE